MRAQEQPPGTGDLRADRADADLRTLYDRARAAHPGVRLGLEAFSEHVARHAADAPEGVGGLRTDDLYLACACAAGDRAALSIFERDHLAGVTEYVARVGPGATVASEVAQVLRVKLLSGDGASPPGIAAYAGRGPLSTWLRVASMRTARTILREQARRGPAPRADAPDAADHRPDPELALLKETGAEDLNRAFAAALSGMTDQERALLRLYFVEGMSLAALGRVYHVHESTMQRRIEALRARLFDSLKSELDVDSRSLRSKLDLVRSRLELHLSRHLAPPRAR